MMCFVLAVVLAYVVIAAFLYVVVAELAEKWGYDRTDKEMISGLQLVWPLGFWIFLICALIRLMKWFHKSYQSFRSAIIKEYYRRKTS